MIRKIRNEVGGFAVALVVAFATMGLGTALAVMGVTVWPGLRVLTRTSRSAHSAAQEREYWITPALAAL